VINITHGFIIEMPHLPVMKWNFKEELVASSKQVVLSGGSPETTYYQYDSKGKRLRKITELAAYTLSPASQKDQRVYIEGFEYYEGFVSGDITETLSLIDMGQRFVMIENSYPTSGPDVLLTRYIHPNHQGSCTLETNDTGDVITYEEYHPFGTTSYQATKSSITAAAKRYRYTGMERDEETGLSYHNARYYIPWLGRWLSPDPIGIGDGVNVYAYCRNNPVKYVDKSGTQLTEQEFTDLQEMNAFNGQDFYEVENTTDKNPTGPTGKEAAEMASHVYGDKEDAILSGGWKKSENTFGLKLNDPKTGFKSAIYEREIKEGAHRGEMDYVYSTAGTDGADGKDWKNNLQQPFNNSEQYKSSIANAKALNENKEIKNLSFTGHSLGGGLAAANAYATGKNAITFNAAGVSSRTQPENSFSKITAYALSSDPLNTIQNNDPASLGFPPQIQALGLAAPDVNGQRVILPTKDFSSLINGHSMNNVLKNFNVDSSKFNKVYFKNKGAPPVNPLQSATTYR